MRLPRSIVTHESFFIFSSGFLGCIITGIFLGATSQLDWTGSAFRYLAFGAGTTALYVVWKRRGFLESTEYALAFALFCAIPSRSTFLEIFVNASLLFLFACILFHLIWTTSGHFWPMGKSLLFALFFAIFELIRTPISAYIISQNNILQSTIVNTQIRGIFGLGIGIGIETAEWILTSFAPHKGKGRRHHG